MIATPNQLLLIENVNRILKYYDLEDSVSWTRCMGSSVFGWPLNDRILRTIVLGRWPSDPAFTANHFHGTNLSFREPGAPSPCLQICIHRNPDSDLGYFVEADVDHKSPLTPNPVKKIGHGIEVLDNTINQKVTDHAAIAKELDARFGKHG